MSKEITIPELSVKLKSNVMHSISNSLNDVVDVMVKEEVDKYQLPSLSNIIDIYVTLDTYRKSDSSNPSDAIYVFDILNRFTKDYSIGIHTSDTLDSIIEIQFSDIYLPDYGEYTYYNTTTDPPLVNNTTAPPAFTRSPYGIIVIEYKELVHILSAITSSIGNHILFRAVVEGSRIRLIPLFNRVTFKTPQIIDKTITLSFTDQHSRLLMRQDTYRNVFVCMCQHNNGIGPFPNNMYLGIMIDRNELFANDRVYIDGFTSSSPQLNDYVTNRGGLYISADYRTNANRSDIVFTNPAIQVNGILDTGIIATRESISNIDDGIYNNLIDGVGATITVVTPVIGGYFDQAINIGNRVLVKDQADSTTNGVYDIISLIPLVLQRISMNVKYGTIITVNSLTTKRYYIHNIYTTQGGYGIASSGVTSGGSSGSTSSVSSNIMVGVTPIIFRLVPFDTQLYTNIVGILSYPVTIRVMNRSFFIPVRYRKIVNQPTNNILPV